MADDQQQGATVSGPRMPTSDMAHLTCVARCADGVIEAVRASDGVTYAPDLIGQTLMQFLPHAAPQMQSLLAQVRATGAKAITLIPYPTAESFVARCASVLLPTLGDGIDRQLVTIQAAPTPALMETLPARAGLDTIIEAIADGVVIYDHEGQPLYYNPAALTLLGWQDASIPKQMSRETKAQVHGAQLVHDPSQIPPMHPVWPALAGEITDPVEMWLNRADGARICVSIRSAPICDRVEGVILGAVVIVRDITLERRVDAIKEEFMSVASHELRAPLQPMILAGRFIQRWATRPDRFAELPRLAQEIVTHAKRMGRLVNDMLDMTRINAGRFTIQPVRCDVRRVVRDAVEEQRAISQRAITLLGGDDPLWAEVDEERIWQALVNLLTNAIKYSLAPAPIEVTLGTCATPEWGECVCLAVRDQGAGIPPEQASHVFERFYRASVVPEVANQQRDGLGLGLYITRAIVESHGGRISVDSTVGAGTTFCIEIPLVAGTERADD